MSEVLHAEVLAYLQSHQVMTLATVGADGPWAAAVFYVSRGYDLFFLSAGHTRHAQNMAVHPHTAVTIQEDYRDWQEIKGVQLEGLVTLLTGDARAEAAALYQAKYPFMAQPVAKIQAALARVNWYRLRPFRLYFVDNTKGFGHRDEVTIPAASGS